MKYAIPYIEKAARLARSMNADYWRLRRQADEAFARGQLAKASDLADDAVEISALYMHIGMAIRPSDEKEQLREFNREAGQWAKKIWNAYERHW